MGWLPFPVVLEEGGSVRSKVSGLASPACEKLGRRPESAVLDSKSDNIFFRQARIRPVMTIERAHTLADPA